MQRRLTVWNYKKLYGNILTETVPKFDENTLTIPWVKRVTIHVYKEIRILSWPLFVMGYKETGSCVLAKQASYKLP